MSREKGYRLIFVLKTKLEISSLLHQLLSNNSLDSSKNLVIYYLEKMEF